MTIHEAGTGISSFIDDQMKADSSLIRTVKWTSDVCVLYLRTDHMLATWITFYNVVSQNTEVSFLLFQE